MIDYNPILNEKEIFKTNNSSLSIKSKYEYFKKYIIKKTKYHKKVNLIVKI